MTTTGGLVIIMQHEFFIYNCLRCVLKHTRFHPSRLLTRVFVDGARCGATVASERFTLMFGSINNLFGSVRDSISSWFD